MKKLLQSFIIFLFVFVFIFPLKVLAHGGVEKRAGNVLVTLFQNPLSPLVGENVTFAYVLTDPSKNHILRNKTARLVITQTYTGDERHDNVVFSKMVKSDVNGVITFSYTFPTTNYYDIDLGFGKSTDEANTTGFLVQPRENLHNTIQLFEVIVVISIMLNFVLLFYWLRNLLQSLRA